MSDRTHLELAIGGERKYSDGRTITAKPISTAYCAGCVFKDGSPKGCVEVWKVLGECGAPWRIDKRNVIFAELDGTPEPEIDHGEFSF